MIAVVDYGLGNLASVRNAFRHVGADAIVTADGDEINRADGIVLPGVGAASAGMQHIRDRGLEQVIRHVARSGRPVLGLCLGMQLLFDRSEEGDTTCLGLIPGTVRRIEGRVKVPHIGWNEVVRRDGSPMFRGISGRPYFYFVHSYVCVPADEQVISGVTEYAGSFCSAVVSKMVWGTQFHPERSGDTGLQLVRNFAALCLGQLEMVPVSRRENS